MSLATMVLGGRARCLGVPEHSETPGTTPKTLVANDIVPLVRTRYRSQPPRWPARRVHAQRRYAVYGLCSAKTWRSVSS